LATKADAGQASGGKGTLLGRGHLFRFAGHELDATSCAAGVAAARVQLVHVRFILQRQDQAFAFWHIECAQPFDC
jgi:hypothetical protein